MNEMMFALRGFAKLPNMPIETWAKTIGGYDIFVSVIEGGRLAVTGGQGTGYTAFRGIETMDDLDNFIRFIGPQTEEDQLLSLLASIL